MTPEQIEQIIDMLAEKLGPIGGQVWSIYMRQVYVGALGALLWLVAFLVGSAIFVRAARWVCANSKDYDKNMFAFFLYAGALACGIAALCALTFGVLRILNPEYHAIQMLLGR